MTDIQTLRNEINEIDEKMAELFNCRMKIVAEIADFKFQNNIEISDFSREKEMLKAASEKFDNPDLNKIYCNFLSAVIDVSKSYQNILIEKKKSDYDN